MAREQYKQERSIVEYFKEEEITQVSMRGCCDNDRIMKRLVGVGCRLEETKDSTCG